MRALSREQIVWLRIVSENQDRCKSRSLTKFAPDNVEYFVGHIRTRWNYYYCYWFIIITLSPGGLTSAHVTYRPRRLWVLRSGGGRDATAAERGDDGKATASVAFDGRDDDVSDDVGWTGIVEAALEQRSANCTALHISAHNDGPVSLYNT